MRIVFLGTPEFAVPTLEALVGAPAHQVTAVVCQPDRPAGRGGALRAPAVELAAARLGLPVYQPRRLRGAEAQPHLDWFRAERPDVLVVVAFGQLLPPAVFDLAPIGAINAHASLLPELRGAAPIQWAIARGATVTGVTTMRIDAGLDTGAMLLQRALPIPPHATAPEISLELARLSAALILETLAGLELGTLTPYPQPVEGISLAPPLSRADGRADWTLPAAVLYNHWRGFQPWPGLHTRFRGQQLAIVRCHARTGAPTAQADGPPCGTVLAAPEGWAVVCGAGQLVVEEVRLEGKRATAAADFARGARLLWGQERLE
ncbi:MAG TPA: methionyl-tRNA formyltransferase [Terriglobales bacterium]|jgi:methionyl-tRNA formyltransferase